MKCIATTNIFGFPLNYPECLGNEYHWEEGVAADIHIAGVIQRSECSHHIAVYTPYEQLVYNVVLSQPDRRDEE